MSEVQTVEALRGQAEKEVEIEGATYRIRRLSPLELLEVNGTLPVLPDGSGKGKKAIPDEEKAVRISSEFLLRGLVSPKLELDELYLIPPGHFGPLVTAISEMTGAARPTDGEESSEASSPSTDSPNATEDAPATS